MINEVRIYDPKDKPYGRLSNNYYDILELGLEPAWRDLQLKKVSSFYNERWKSVTNFVYATLITTPSYRTILQGASPMAVQDEFSHLQEMEINGLISSALVTGYSKLFENPEMTNLLVETGNSPILYNSPNNVMGVGLDGQGLNLVGKTLELVRHRLLVTYKDQKSEKVKTLLGDKIYEGYLARQVLVDLMANGDTLNKYLSLSTSEIAKKYKDVLGQYPVSKDIVMNMYENGILHPSILASTEKAGIIVAALRKEGLRDLKASQEIKRQKIAFGLYADHIIEDNFPDLTDGNEWSEGVDKREAALAQQLSTISYSKQLDMQDKVYSLWENGKMAKNFSRELAGVITLAMDNLKIPKENEIIEAEAVQLDYTLSSTIQGLKYKPTTGEATLIYSDPSSVTSLSPKFVAFSPISIHMLFINSLYYPTVSHYLAAKLFSAIPLIGTMKKSHTFLLDKRVENIPHDSIEAYVSPDVVWERYHEEQNKQYAFSLKANAAEALDYKFKNRVYQNVLLTTANAKLIWADPKDSILGLGPDGKGENFVGTYLIYLRENIRQEREVSPLGVITTSEITDLLENDLFFQGWLALRLVDLCGVCKAMQNYTYRAKKKSLRMTADFVSVVMDNIYQPCSHLSGLSAEITEEAPESFVDIVRTCTNKGEPDTRGFGDASPETVDEIWKRMAVLIYHLIKITKDADIINIRTTLAQATYTVSQKTQCARIVTNNQNNCIISALTNIMMGIVAYNKKFGYTTNIESQDVKTAVTILLNIDIEEEIKPALEKEDNYYPDDNTSFTVKEQKADDDDDSDDAEGADYGEEKSGGDEDEYTPKMNKIPEEEEKALKPWWETLPPRPKINKILPKLPVQQKKDIMDSGEILEVQKYLEKTMQDVKDPKEIAKYIIGATEAVKTSRINKALKQNRINFFATVTQLQ